MSELNDAVEVAKLDPASGWRLGNDANRLMMESKSISVSRVIRRYSRIPRILSYRTAAENQWHCGQQQREKSTKYKVIIPRTRRLLYWHYSITNILPLYRSNVHPSCRMTSLVSLLSKTLIL